MKRKLTRLTAIVIAVFLAIGGWAMAGGDSLVSKAAEKTEQTVKTAETIETIESDKLKDDPLKEKTFFVESDVPAVQANSSDEILGSGTCGDNLTWTLTGDGTLTISGTGEMDNWEVAKTPWDDLRTEVTKIEIAGDVTSIGEHAFYNFNSLTAITIPYSVASIGDSAFGQCSSLTKIIIPGNVKNIGDFAFYNCRNLVNVSILEGVTHIGENAFGDCRSLMNVNIPDTVMTIGSNAFYNCVSLIYMNIPNSVTDLGRAIFRGCTSLSSVEIFNGVTSISSSMFYNCRNLQEVIIPNSVISIESFAFENCSSLTSITIPDSIETIGVAAFEGCSSLTDIKIPDSVTEIGNAAFSDCSSLSNFILPTDITKVSANLFNGCSSLDNITIPDGVTEIEYQAFLDCSSLKSITIPDNVLSVESAAFRGCSSLTDAYISSNITSIDWGMFFDCSSLTSISIPNGVTNIGNSAFRECDNLTSISIPASVISIESSAFLNCDSLTDVYYSGSEDDWAKIDIELPDNSNFDLVNAVIHYNSFGMEKDDLSHFVSMSPENGATDVEVEITSDFILKVTFDSEVVAGEGNIYICDYDTGEVYRTINTHTDINRQGFYVNPENSKELIIWGSNWPSDCMISSDFIINNIYSEDLKLIPYDTKLCVKIDSNAIHFKDLEDTIHIQYRNSWTFTTEFGLTRDKDMFLFSNQSTYFENEHYNLSTPVTLLLNLLCEKRTDYTKIAKDIRENEWGGSCDGMSNVMALVQQDLLDLSAWKNALTDNSNAICADVKFPRDSKDEFGSRDLINYYQLLQNLESYPRVEKKWMQSQKEYLSSFIDVCENTINNKNFLPITFQITYKEKVPEETDKYIDKKIRHTCLVIGVDNYSDKVCFDLYDPNNPGYSTVMAIDSDYNVYLEEGIYLQYMQDKNVTVKNLSYVEPQKLDENDYNIDIFASSYVKVSSAAVEENISKASFSEIADINQTLLSCSGSGNFIITNAEGQIICCEDGELDGTMNVYDYSIVGSGEDFEYRFYVDPSESFTYTTDDGKFSLSVEQDEQFSSISANGTAESVTVLPGNSVSASGEGDINYSAGFNYFDNITELILISGISSGDVSAAYTEEGIILDSDYLKDTVVDYYNGTEVSTEEYGNSDTGIIVNVELSSQISIGDVNNDGSLNVADLMMCLQYVSGRSELTGGSLQAADINEDGSVDVVDLMRLLHYVSGRSTVL